MNILKKIRKNRVRKNQCDKQIMLKGGGNSSLALQHEGKNRGENDGFVYPYQGNLHNLLIIVYVNYVLNPGISYF
jgi:hypothetical protein